MEIVIPSWVFGRPATLGGAHAGLVARLKSKGGLLCFGVVHRRCVCFAVFDSVFSCCFVFPGVGVCLHKMPCRSRSRRVLDSHMDAVRRDVVALQALRERYQMRGMGDVRQMGGRGRVTNKPPTPNLECMCCGDVGHFKASCPDLFKTCNLCGIVGHLSKTCRQVRSSSNNTKHKHNSINSIQRTDSVGPASSRQVVCQCCG